MEAAIISMLAGLCAAVSAQWYQILRLQEHERSCRQALQRIIQSVAEQKIASLDSHAETRREIVQAIKANGGAGVTKI